MGRIDLHIHSSLSDDGDFEPRALARMAGEAGLEWMAVADHNSVAAHDEAVDEGAAVGVRVLPAVELDCAYGDLHLHVLGYGVNPRFPAFEGIAAASARAERDASSLRMERVSSLGIAVDRDLLERTCRRGVVTAELIAEIALGDPRNEGHPLLTPYRAGGGRSDNPFVNFYWDYCSPGKPAYVFIRRIGLDEAVRAIRDSGGIAVLAHPGILLKDCEHKLAELVDNGISGVEIYSSYHTPAECGFWGGRAAALRILGTCGSDFHGKTKPAIKLGMHGGDADERRLLAGLLDALQGWD